MDGSGQQRAHAEVAFHPSGGLVVEPVDPYGGPDQVGQHRQLDPGLTERRKHLLDVGDE